MSYQRIDLSVPLTIPSGILADIGISEKLYEMEAEIGGYELKTFMPEQRLGNVNPVWYWTPHYSMNAMGLYDPGMEALREMLEAIESPIPLIYSVGGSSPEEYGDVTRFYEGVKTMAEVKAWDINASCPNASARDDKGKSIRQAIGSNADVVFDVVKAVSKETDKPIITKLSYASPYVEIAEAAVEAGSDYICCINTIPGRRYDVFAKAFVLSAGRGGVSGPGIFPMMNEAVYSVYEVVQGRAGVIACGGIGSGSDMVEAMAMGAEKVQMGSSLVGLDGKPLSLLEIKENISIMLNEARHILSLKDYGSWEDVVGVAHV